MDTVILAAGKGERLAGISAPFHKPLMVVNGESLIHRAVRQARRVCDKEVILVVAPENALPISQIVADMNVTMIVQRKADGPASALWEGLKVCRSDRVMVLMSDNYTSDEDVDAMCERQLASYSLVVGTQRVEIARAVRFTYRTSAGAWIEKLWPAVTEPIVDAWVGPVIMRTSMIHEFIDALMATGRGPYELGPLFNDFPTQELVSVSSIDIGIPEALA